MVRCDCVCSFSVSFAFPLDAGVWRLPAMALGLMRGYMTKKKKKKKKKKIRSKKRPKPKIHKSKRKEK